MGLDGSLGTNCSKTEDSTCLGKTVFTRISMQLGGSNCKKFKPFSHQTKSCFEASFISMDSYRRSDQKALKNLFVIWKKSLTPLSFFNGGPL
ncbi:hypothetical protein HanIR_Chr08g0383921 [Helianthus annuus]|nr:hypothetical protein HanIR_Chr08g0383921 [Helianthus annuus]